MSDGTIHFLPYVRTGLSSGLTGPPAALPIVTPTMTVRATTVAGAVEEMPVTAPSIRLDGPGAVTAINESVWANHQPGPNSATAETNGFAAIEIAPADLPWRYTPGGPTAERLRPWMVVIVVEAGVEAEWSPPDAGRLPALTVHDSATSLPPLDESWAWAHAQFRGDRTEPGAFETALGDGSGRLVARLLCPRRTEPGRTYWACVVPAFEAGRLAGLGQPGSDDLSDAWTGGAVELPVFTHWTFTTAASGDFESLVRRLTPVELSEQTGLRPLDTSDPGAGLTPTDPDEPAYYAGALIAPGARWKLAELDATLSDDTKKRATELAEAANRSLVTEPTEDDPVVALPAYGRMYQKEPAVPTDPRHRGWYRELNATPRHRTAAALGAAVIRDQQEVLLDQAWDAVGAAAEANAALNASRLAIEVNQVAQRRVTSGAPADTVRFVSSALHTVNVGGRTASAHLRASAVPNAMFSGPFRRMARAGTGIGSTDTDHPAAALTAEFLGDPLTPTGQYRDELHPMGAIADEAPTPLALGFSANSPGIVRLARPRIRTRQRSSFKGGEKLGSLTATVADATDPVLMMNRSLTHRLHGADLGLPPVAITPQARRRRTGAAALPPARLSTHPEFSLPTYQGLRDLGVDYLVPGADGIPDDSLGLLVNNDAFIEAFLVGVNHEMGREFLWREFPTPLNATWFRRFWQRPDPDIEPIIDWTSVARLGQQNGTRSPDVALVIRGELPRRYPNLRLYAAPAKWEKRTAADPDIVLTVRAEDRSQSVIPPSFAATLDPDLYAFGFELDVARARGTTDPDQPAGYFFVFEEPESAPRFGLEALPTDGATTFGNAPSDWTTTNWADVTPAGATDPAAFVRVEATAWMTSGDEQPTNGPDGETDGWAEDAAAIARQCHQRPVRVLVHADALLPEAQP
ncbi:MAG: hypothetical protein GY929_21310 [Actinomycetia bacterium]|nr:hypothetical protein [Actinomycetes bacterium]